MPNCTRRVSRRLCTAISVAAIASLGTFARATTYNWTGNGADGYFDDANNWDVGTGYPGSTGTSDVAVFGSAVTTTNQPSLDINDSIGELIFQSTAGGWVLGTTSSSNVLTLNGGTGGFGIDATVQTSGVTDIQANLSVAAAQTWAVGAGGTLEIDGIISGSSALTLGSSTATGTIELTAVSSAFTGAVTIASGTTLQLGNGSSSSTDGLIAGPITLAAASSILTFDDVGAHTYSAAITGSAGSTLNDNGTGTLTLTASSTSFQGTAKIAGGATLQLGNGSTIGILGSSSTIALQSGSSPVSTLTFDEPSAQTYGGTVTGPSGSVINISGPSAGVVTSLTHLSTSFNGTANVLGKNTLQFGNGTSSSADGLFGSTSTIALSSTAVLTFDEDSARAYAGAISGATGAAVNISGPSAGVTTTLSNLNPNFKGTVTLVGSNVLQLGNGSSSSADGNFGTGATVNMGATNFNIDDAGSETLPFTVNSSPATSGFINFNGNGTIKFTGAINLTNVNSFLIFNGGAVNITGSINASTDDNSEYFYDRTNSTITLSNATNSFEYAPKFYMQAINGATAFTSENMTLAAGATLTGSSFTVISNDNNNASSPYTSAELPPAVVFNDNGKITTPTLYLNYNTSSTTAAIGQTTLNINGTSSQPASVVGNIYTGFNTDTLNSATATINIGAYGSNSSTTSPVKEQFSLDVGNYTYLTVAGTNAAISALPASGGTGLFYLGDGGDAFMEIGSGGTVSVNDGSGATNSYAAGGSGLVLADTYSGATAVLNVYTGGTLNYTPSNTGDTNFFIGTTSGQVGVMNVIGGKVNNQGNNSPITIGGATGVNAQLNINSDSNGNPGLVITSYVRTTSGSTTSFLNFNGGELEYSNVANGSQANFISSSLSGYVYVFGNGATIGTNASSNAGPTVTIPVSLQAPSGNGITSITVTNSTSDKGYTAPPIVVITGGNGKDAAAYATINAAGQITNVIITNPGFGYTSAPTISFIDGGAPINSGGAAYSFTAATATATIGPDATTGGLTKVDNGTLILSASNGYGGPTLVEAGTLQFSGASNATNAVTVLTTPSVGAVLNTSGSSTNNIASAAILLIGDLPTSATLASPAMFTISNTGGFVLSSAAEQTLGGFGIVTGSSSIGLTVGNLTVIAPGTGSGQVVQSLTATPGTYTVTGSNSAFFNTGNKGNAGGTATGALTIGNQTGTITTFAGGGTYYWKLNMDTGGSGVTTSPGIVPHGGGDVSGSNWDALILDSLNVTATPTNAFTIQAVAYPATPDNNATNPVTIGTGNDPSYSWTIARIGGTNGNPPNLASILADLSLNTSGMPTPSNGYAYYLTLQQDPQMASDTDIVLNYSPVPEPCSALLLLPAAGLLLRRRRKSSSTR